MKSPNKPAQTAAERRHAARIAEMHCAVCDAAGPSEVHEIRQGEWFLSLPLCPACHRGQGGWHGTRALWNVRKLDQLGALAITIRRLMTA